MSAVARRRRAFRSADVFAIAAWKACRRMATGEGADLAREIRRGLGAAGGTLLAAAGHSPGGAAERAALAEARDRYQRVLYLLYLGRRIGVFDLTTYRRLAESHRQMERDLAGNDADQVQVVDRCGPFASGSTNAR